MKDVRKEVYQALDGALSCPVHFLSPPAGAGEIPALAQMVDAAMQSIGFARISAQDLPPDEAGLYHKNMQYAMLA